MSVALRTAASTATSLHERVGEGRYRGDLDGGSTLARRCDSYRGEVATAGFDAGSVMQSVGRRSP